MPAPIFLNVLTSHLLIVFINDCVSSHAVHYSNVARLRDFHYALAGAYTPTAINADRCSIDVCVFDDMLNQSGKLVRLPHPLRE